MSCLLRKNKILSAREAKEFDQKARDIYGMSTLVLMENAGRAVAIETLKVYRAGLRIAVFCGKGNNGGDGFVAARHLLAQRICTDTFLLGRISQVRNEARANLTILQSLKQKIVELSPGNTAKVNLDKYDIIIDAFLGVGLHGPVSALYFDLISRINAAKAYILSVDIPSGLDATTGMVQGVCVKADKTVTFIAKKQGMVKGQGPKYCGKIIVVDLGLPVI